MSEAMNRLTLFIFIDAFGAEIYNRYGFLNEIIQSKQRLKTVFGFSSAADPSILTGRYPVDHGHWSTFYYAPQNSPFKLLKPLSILPKSIFNRGRVRHWMSKIIKKWYGFTGYFQIYSIPFNHLGYFDYLEKRDYFVPGGILRGDTIFDWCVAHNIPYHCSNWRLSEGENIDIARKYIDVGACKFIYLYLPKLDAVMHQYGTHHPEVGKKLKTLEDQIIPLYKKAQQQYDDVALYIISDHGMDDVTGTIDLMGKMAELPLKYGSDYVAIYDATMGRFWFLNAKSREMILNHLGDIKGGSWISTNELERLGVYFRDQKFGEAIFLTEPGIMINPSHMGQKAMAGMHGYHPDAPGSDPVILSNRLEMIPINSISDIRKIMAAEIGGGG